MKLLTNDMMRHVKIGFQDDNDKTFYLTASNEVGKEDMVAATEVSKSIQPIHF